MGVLDINDRLKHRIKITDEVIEDPTWEGSEVPNELPIEEPEPTRSPRQRRPKLRPKYLVNTSSVRPKGSRSGRRYENTCFLLSLVDHEEIQELELSDIVNQTMTIFSTLFEDPQKMKIWNDYASLPEDEQYQFIHSQTDQTRKVASTTSAAKTEDTRENHNEKMFADAEKAYFNIDKKIRGTFQKKRFPMGGLEILEEDLLSCFSDLPDAVMVSMFPSSLDRMMVHAICQYLKLACQSHNCHGTRLMEIENRRIPFKLPCLLLSQYLRKKVLS